MPRSCNKICPAFGGILFFLFGFCGKLAAQEQNLVNGDFDSTSFSGFVTHIESTSSYHFYYDASEMDSFKVNLHFRDQRLDSVLSLLFRNTAFRFAIDSVNEVFVTRHVNIQTIFPHDFFTVGGSSPDTVGAKDIQPEQTSQKLKSSVENRLFEIGSLAAKPNYNKA